MLGNNLRNTTLQIVHDALQATSPEAAVQADLSRHEAELGPSVYIFGAGKAAASMARGAETILGRRVQGGLVVVKSGGGLPLRRVRVVESAHPVPDETSLAAGQLLVQALAQVEPPSAVLFLLSGGASSLVEQLAPGMTLEALQQLTSELLARGATIKDMNTVRKHLSRLKGGQLAHHCRVRPAVVLILSDVGHGSLDTVGSGPLLPDTTSVQDAAAILQNHGLEGWTPRLVETCSSGFEGITTRCVGDADGLATAAAIAARGQGYPAVVLPAYLEGEAHIRGVSLATMAQHIRTDGRPLPAPCCVVGVGETTVTLAPGAGRGGRNQEMALAAALALQGQAGVVFLAAASDGNDGPTDAAGAWADGDTVDRARALGLDAADFLRRHDSYSFFEALGDLLKLGPTRSNLNDLYLLLVDDSVSPHQN